MPKMCQAALNCTNRNVLPSIITLLLFLMQFDTIARNNSHPPEIRNIHAQQRFGTRLVDITFDLIDPDDVPLLIQLTASEDNGGSYTLIPRSLSGDVGEGIHPGDRKRIVWDVGAPIFRV